MQGMIAGQMPEQDAQPFPDPSMGAEQAEESFTPEQAEAYDRFIVAAQKVLYEDGMARDLAKRIKAADDPVQGMADAAYDVLAALDERSGGMLDDELIVPAAAEILGMIFEITRAAKVPVTGEQVAAAAKSMVERYLKESGASEQDIAMMSQGVDLQGAGAQIDAELES